MPVGAVSGSFAGTAFATATGAEGLDLTPGEHYVRADEEQMAQALVDAIRNPGPVREMAEKGRVHVRDLYDWEVLAEKLEGVWQRCVGGDGRDADGSKMS